VPPAYQIAGGFYMSQIFDFISTDLGAVASLLFAGILFIVISGYLFKKSNFSPRALAYTGLTIAVAFILSYFRLFSMPQGGSITFLSMFFVALIGFWFGPAIGLISAISYGFLQLVQGAYIVHPVQFLLEYPVAFGMLGLSGFFYKMKGGMYVGFLVGAMGRYFTHTMAGWVYFGHFAPEGTHPLIYSAIYNAYIPVEIVITMTIIFIPTVRHALAHIKKLVVSNTVR